MFRLEECVGFITSNAAKELSDEFNRRLGEEGSTRVQWIALYYIGKEDGISQKALANKMNVKESTIVRLVDRMEKDSIVKREKEKADRRVTNIYLTDKGNELRKGLMPMGEKFSDDATRGIKQEHLDIFSNVLRKMVTNINENVDNIT
ncbi:MarR family transcriptional regulator [Clostridium sp.]|uniref:MarR family winged helix-turn-helix transcriptional regulator n=1 Tax=Clostridium sp. TaxID=1506 RepID=UPI0032164435